MSQHGQDLLRYAINRRFRDRGIVEEDAHDPATGLDWGKPDPPFAKLHRLFAIPFGQCPLIPDPVGFVRGQGRNAMVEIRIAKQARLRLEHLGYKVNLEPMTVSGA